MLDWKLVGDWQESHKSSFKMWLAHKNTHHKNKHIKSYIKGAIEKYTIEEKKMEGKKSKRRENVFFSAFLTTGLFLLKQFPVWEQLLSF